jgi:hypothetical protein
MSRFDYVQYDQEAQDQQKLIKEICKNVEHTLDLIVPPPTENTKPDSNAFRARALAITKLEEVYMWAGKAIRDQQIMRNGNAPLQEERNNG